jgi:WD40 repeat protein
MPAAKTKKVPRLCNSFSGHSHGVYDIAFSPDGVFIASGGFDGIAKLWYADPVDKRGNLRGNRDARTFQGHQGIVTAVAFHPTHGCIATAAADQTARLWDVQSGREMSRIPHADKVADVAFSPDGTQIATACIDGYVRAWEIGTGKLTLTIGTVELKGRDGLQDMNLVLSQATALAYSPDGRRLAVGSGTGKVSIYDAASGKEVVTTRGHTTSLHRIVFSPDGACFATGGYDNTARIWDASTGCALAVLSGYEKWVLALAFSPDGKKLAVGSRDHTADVWAAPGGQKLTSLPRHAGGVWSADFSPDGKTLATASYDGSVQVWDPRC